ncbi:MAG: hypothetical protein Kow00124_26560 [Anaerolineae bacterium]
MITRFVRLAAPHQRLRLRVTLGAALMMALVGTLGVTQAGHALTPWRSSLFYNGLLTLIWALMLLTPAALAAGSALLTYRHLRQELYQLLRLTDVPQPVLMLMHLFANLYRMRVLVILLVGAVPALLVGMTHSTRVWLQRTYPTMMLSTLRYAPLPPPVYSPPLWRLNLLGWWPELPGWAIGIPGVGLLAVILGVGLTLWWRRVEAAAPAAAMLALLLGGLTLGLIPALPLEEMSKTAHVMLSVGLAAWPYLLSVGLAAWLRRWA